MSPYSNERGAELRELFFETSQELLQSLNDEALKVEKRPKDQEAVRVIRRVVHTLKGDAAACGFKELSELAHELEDVLGIDTSSSKVSLADVAFTAADTFAAMIAAYRKKGKLPTAQSLRKMMQQLSAQPAAGKARKTKRKPAVRVSHSVWTEYEKLAVQNAVVEGKRVFHVGGQIDPDCAMPIAARQMVMNALAAAGEVLGSRPEAGSTASSSALEFLLASDNTAEQVKAKCSIPTVTTQVSVELFASPSKKQLEAGKTGEASLPPESLIAEHDHANLPEPSSAAAENILRVDAARIDNVLNLVGELIIGKSMLQQALNEFARLHPKEALRSRFADAMAFQARVLNDLQRSVMKIRMVPVEQLFRRFPRMVRDVAKACGKEVELDIRGEHTDLDKSILDAISEPLTHIVRNAVSHGIEDPAERTRLGKPVRGTVRLNAYHQGNQVIVEVTDDGRGIDLRKLAAKAIEQNLVTAEQAARMSDTELLDLVFRPGFSTAEQVTEISGRGVGLDVVQSVLLRLKGSVSITTQPGQGTTFCLKLPLTLAIIKALLFRVDKRLYAIPLNTVAEIARAFESELHQVDNYEVLQLRNQILPLVRLGHSCDECSLRKIFILVVSSGERRFGLIVDALEGEEELVIKALDDQSVATDMVSGASILGDGRVVLILNMTAIVERLSRSRPNAPGEVSSGLLLPHSDSTQSVPNNTEARS